MLVLDTKISGEQWQYRSLNEAILAAQFIRNKAIRYWMDNTKVGKYDLSKLCATLAKEFDWADKLNSMARQASAERAWQSIARFYDNCKKGKPGKKGYPHFKKHSRSVEYKTSGWKLSEDRKYLTFTDGFKAGTFKLIGGFDLNYYQIAQIKRIRVVRRADGYYAQFCIDINRNEEAHPTGRAIGLDVGLNYFYTTSDGVTLDNPHHLRKSHKALKRSQRKVSRRQKNSKNRQKAISEQGRKHLKVQRQGKDYAVKAARCVVMSNDFIAYEDLKVSNMVKNRCLSKSISDAGWSQFLEWLQYFGKVFGKAVVAVPPHYTSQNCSGCGVSEAGRSPLVKKSRTSSRFAISVRTHQCKCGVVLERDPNAAINILVKALKLTGYRMNLSTPGHGGINALGEDEPYLDP